MPKMPNNPPSITYPEEEKFTDKQRAFVRSYVNCYCVKQAALDAGCSEERASNQGYRWISKPHVRKAIGYYEERSRRDFEIERYEVLEQLLYCATRSGEDFVDENGELINNIRHLPPRARKAIDAIKQRKRKYLDEDGNRVEEIETDLKLVSKSAAIDMCMRHKGLYAVEKHLNANVNLTAEQWDELQNSSRREAKEDDVDPIEAEILKIEQGEE